MNVTQRGVITLIKSAVTGEALPLPQGFDLEKAYPLIKSHHMIPLAYQGAVGCGLPRDLPVMGQLFQGYCRYLMISEGQMAQAQRIFDAFDNNGIDYLPLKGCNMKSLYPKPELRTMGDADILIRMDQYDRIIPIMEALGFAPKKETDYELGWVNKKLYVELHSQIAPFGGKEHPYFGNGWKLARKGEGCRFSLPAEEEWLFLFTHFARHYRNGGIGCRHVTDLWVYLRTHPNLDEETIQAGLEKLHLLEFYGNTRRLLDCWFDEAAGDEKTEFMTEYIFASGSWGKLDSRILSQTVAVADQTGLTGKLAYLWQLAFPPAHVLRKKYTLLQKAPWLLPLVWLYRPVYKVLFERKDLGRQKGNLQAVDAQKVSDRQQALRYVGLDFQF